MFPSVLCPQIFTETLPQNSPCHRSLSLTTAYLRLLSFCLFFHYEKLSTDKSCPAHCCFQHGRTVQVPTAHTWRALDSSEMPTLAHRSTQSFRKTPGFLISTIRGVPVTRVIKHLFCVCHEHSKGRELCVNNLADTSRVWGQSLAGRRIGCLHLFYREPATNTASHICRPLSPRHPRST